MKRLEWSSLSAAERSEALARPKRRHDPEVAEVVRRIFDDVEREGEAAVARWARSLDGRVHAWLELSPVTLDAARGKLDARDLDAIDFAIDQVRFYHEASAPRPQTIEPTPGVQVTRMWRSISKCGLYVPAGGAPLISTLIMLAEPSRVAGVRERVLVSPPGQSGDIHPAMIVAAAACGLQGLWKIGGAQAIAALTFGAGLPKVDKIFGPGNAFVAAAKRYAASLPGGPAIDLPAGPSELMVIADAGANPVFVAADLLSQAEHDGDAQVLFVSPSAELLDAVQTEVERQTETLPRRDVVRASMAQARFIRVRDIEEAADIANAYAPEHLCLPVAQPSRILDKVENAGAIFVGQFGAESFGDYVAGPSHVLPTDGAAKAWSGVSAASFMKSFTIQKIDAEGVRRLTEPTARLARLEGLEAHARAADVRGAESTEASQDQVVIRRRRAELLRETRETKIALSLDLDKQAPPTIDTGVGFYDHMLAQVAQHGGFALTLKCDGDLDIDAHHTIEDCALALGACLKQALGERRGIARFGFVLPMDETEAKVSIDLGGRAYLVFDGAFKTPALGAYPTEMTEHVFRSLSQSMGASIHVTVTGENDHHKTEACFKALGRALRQAITIEGATLPSTKGVIE
ncbi:MAG: histidinol dehydrogenase [Caulobacteraceae bacterium]